MKIRGAYLLANHLCLEDVYHQRVAVHVEDIWEGKEMNMFITSVLPSM
jgi:hypothetical protein